VVRNIATVVMVLGEVAVVGFVPALVVWWSTATGCYLRMAHAWGIGLALSAMAVLVSANLVIFVFVL
jgi:hypothetical protein